MFNTKLGIVFASILAAVLVFNQFQIVSLHAMMRAEMNFDQTVQGGDFVAPLAADGSVDLVALARQILPTGIPNVYGAELGVSFDDAGSAIAIFTPFEQDTRVEKMSGTMLQRYIDLGKKTACEFCCSATTLVFADGSMACACGHSAAMRGVMAYLLENSSMSDGQILDEVNKWKAAFFPGPTVERYAQANGFGAVSSENLESQVGGC